MNTPVPLLLRRALLADAIASGASGALLSFDAAPLAALFGLPASLLQAAGMVSLAWGLLAAWLGTRDALWRPAVWAVIGGNVVWVLASVELLFSAQPSTLGLAYVIAQALLVALFAELQFMGLRSGARGALRAA